MNLSKLPDDILLIIIDEMNADIFTVSIVNKEFNELSQNRLKEEKAARERKKAFYERCKGGRSFYWNAFHGVQTLEECYWLREKWLLEEFGNQLSFISRVRYTRGNTFQVAAETWTSFLIIHDPQEQPQVSEST